LPRISVVSMIVKLLNSTLGSGGSSSISKHPVRIIVAAVIVRTDFTIPDFMTGHFNIITVIGVKYYFLRKYIFTGVPEKSYLSLSLFSIYLLYGSLTYCGRLQNRANAG